MPARESIFHPLFSYYNWWYDSRTTHGINFMSKTAVSASSCAINGASALYGGSQHRMVLSAHSLPQTLHSPLFIDLIAPRQHNMWLGSYGRCVIQERHTDGGWYSWCTTQHFCFVFLEANGSNFGCPKFHQTPHRQVTGTNQKEYSGLLPCRNSKPLSEQMKQLW